MLDGKYEITSERDLGERVTLFGATAPDGTALVIHWFELEAPADERAFERYRVLLRQLRRDGHAAVYDLVSRPGAHYVAWRLPEGDAPNGSGAELRSIETVLEAHGRSLSEALIRARPDAPPQVYGLAFAGALEPLHPPAPAPATTPEVVDKLWIRLWQHVRSWVLAGTLALFGVLFLMVGALRALPNRLVPVPAVEGQDVNAALTALHQAGFAATAVGFASPRPAGTVLEVLPPAGTPLRPGRTLSVRYALPPGRTPARAPGVTGLTVKQAERALQRAGFRVGSVASGFGSAPAGTVVAQRPAAAAPAVPGGRFALLVSDGPRGAKTFLPDLKGLGLEDALGLAEAAGFARETVRLERVPGGGRAETVLAQNLTPFTEVPLTGSVLRLTLAAAGAAVPAESGTPDLTGLGLGEAQRRARALGLGVRVEAAVSAPELPGGVVQQQPPPGAPLGASVQVTLNAAARALPRPRVTTTVRRDAAPLQVRRARYVWQLGADAAGQMATVTVTFADGTRRVVVRQRVVGANERLAGTYLTTARGPLTFSLTLGGGPYGTPLRVP